MSLIYTNAMLDLETMGNSPDAAIVAIGAVAFDLEAGELGSTWYNRISLESAVQAGGVIDASTVLWWLQQSEEARQEIARPGGMHINEALRRFAGWLAETTEPDVVMWGNGASFDNVILRSAYQRAGQAAPWSWWNDRCYRTVKAMHRDVPIERIGTHHNALSDATSQAAHLIKMLAPRPPDGWAVMSEVGRIITWYPQRDHASIAAAQQIPGAILRAMRLESQ